MGIMDQLRRLLSKAKEEAGEVAAVARIKLDVRTLEAKRDHLLREIGRQALALHREGRGVREFDTACADVQKVEAEIREREEELRRVRVRPDGADAAGTTA